MFNTDASGRKRNESINNKIKAITSK